MIFTKIVITNCRQIFANILETSHFWNIKVAFFKILNPDSQRVKYILIFNLTFWVPTRNLKPTGAHFLAHADPWLQTYIYEFFIGFSSKKVNYGYII